MSEMMKEQSKRWTARRKSALVLEIIRGKTTVAAASRQFDLTPAEIESSGEDGKRGTENALRVIAEWIAFYNQQLHHQALKMMTPDMAYTATLTA